MIDNSLLIWKEDVGDKQYFTHMERQYTMCPFESAGGGAGRVAYLTGSQTFSAAGRSLS